LLLSTGLLAACTTPEFLSSISGIAFVSGNLLVTSTTKNAISSSGRLDIFLTLKLAILPWPTELSKIMVSPPLYSFVTTGLPSSSYVTTIGLPWASYTVTSAFMEE